MLTAEALRQTIRSTLQRRIHGADSGAVASATVATWDDMASQLSRVIGPGGVAALLGRALNVTCAEFEWLAAPVGFSGGPIAGLAAKLSERPVDVATDASVALLANYAELLAALIGPSLCERLLNPVWASPPSASSEERQ